MGPIQPAIQWYRVLSREEMWPRREFDHSLPSSTEITKEQTDALSSLSAVYSWGGQGQYFTPRYGAILKVASTTLH